MCEDNDKLRLEFENPSGIFFPGQEIKGTVYLQADTVYHARALNLFFDGRAKTKWFVQEEYKERTFNKTKTSFYSKEYSATVVYVDHSVLLWTAPNHENELPVGNYSWPFSYTLPVECAPSFESEFGSIEYYVKAEFDRPWRIDEAQKKTITVSPVLDLNRNQKLFQNITDQSVESVGCCLFPKGYVDLTVDLPKRGYVPGETLSMQVDINNRSRIPVQQQTAIIDQKTRYVAFRDGETYVYNNIGGIMNAISIRETKDEQKEIARASLNVTVPPGTSRKVEIQLIIPEVTPTINSLCPIIAVDYEVQVETDTFSKCGSNNECNFEIMIGTVPINQYIPPRVYPAMGPTENLPLSTDEKPPIKEDGTVIIPSAPLLPDEQQAQGS